MITSIHGQSIYYEIIGEGKPVLILHGWGASVDTMAFIGKYVASLGYAAYMFDFPGFGKSSVPSVPWNVFDYAALTREFMVRANIVGADVICHSFGGRVVIALASKEETLFNRLILVDAAGIRPKRTAKYYVRTYTYKLLKQLARVGIFKNAFEKRAKNAGSEDYRALSGAMKKTFVNVVNQDLRPRLSRIKNETLLIWGENDTDTPLYMAKIMEREIQNVGLAVIKRAGHFSFVDDYATFCAIIGAMLM